MNHVLMNKLDDELSIAIQSVGGDVSGAKGPWDYPEIIKNQLSANGSNNGSLKDYTLGPGLKVEEVGGEKILIATSGALTTCTLNPPTGSYMQPIHNVIEAGTPIQKVLEDLFYEILPKMPSLYKGDVIVTNGVGSDQYNEEDVKSGLDPNTIYLRLYVANRQEPIYISLKAVQGSGSNPGGGGSTINISGGNTTYFSVNVVNGYITVEPTADLLNIFQDVESLKSTFNGVDLGELKKDLESLKNLNIDEIVNYINNHDGRIAKLESDILTKANTSDLDKIAEELELVKGSIGDVDFSEIESKLGEFQTQLDTKVDSSTLNDTLVGYATKDDLNSKVDSSTLNDTLAGYATQSDVQGAVDDVVDNVRNEIQSEISKIEPGVSEERVAELVETTVVETVVKELGGTEGATVTEVVEQIVNDIVVEKVTNPENVMSDAEAEAGVNEIFDELFS